MKFLCCCVDTYIVGVKKERTEDSETAFEQLVSAFVEQRAMKVLLYRTECSYGSFQTGGKGG